MEKAELNKKYLKKARFWAWILGYLPGVRSVFLSGSVAQGRVSEGSDIDLFFITHHGQIWTGRFFVFFVLKLCRQIATDAHHAGQICPNHFITDKNLKIEEKDAYAAHLFAHNLPLHDPADLWAVFVKANKNWIKNFGEEFSHSPQNPNKKFKKKKAGFFAQKLELGLKKIQIKKIKHNHQYFYPGAKIILKDTELRFHPKPKNKSWGKENQEITNSK